MNKTSRPHDEAVVELLRADPSFADEYLEAAMEEVDQEGGPQALLFALRQVAEAQGITVVAERAGIPRESLYRVLSPNGNCGCWAASPLLVNIRIIMQGIFKVIYNPVFVAAELNTRAQKLSKNYEVEASDGYYTIYDAKMPIYESPNPKDVQLQLDRIRLVRSFARK